MTAVLDIHLFGSPDIRLGGAPIGGFVSTKAPALLAYLAVTGRPHSRDTLVALLWGEMADADAKNNLRQTLSNLRKLLEPYLLITRDAVQFNTAVPHTLDTAQFENHLHRARDATLPTRMAALQQATALYQGDFLAGFYVRDAPEFEEWLLAQRVRYRELALHALHTVTGHHLERGEYGRAIDAATRLLALDPWREAAYRQLMQALTHSGQRVAALAQYETCRRVLAKELGVSPSAETTALYQRIRAAGEEPRHNLPPQPTPFVGRAAELAEISALLLRPECRLVTLLGAGGIGKTRLALQAATQASQRSLFLHGVYFVSLEGVETLTGLVTAVAQSIGFSFSGSQEPAAQLLAHLHERELLLVLDNFEQLLGSALWLTTLLQQATHLKLLLTSRERLHVQWEWCVTLDGLDFPATSSAVATPTPQTDLTTYSAVQLFLNRARAARHDFLADDDTAVPHIIRICQLTAGMPLALELAAANIRHFSCAEIAEAIAHNLDFLASTYRDIPTRQRSVRAVFDYSWGLLNPAEQQLFAALSVFRGSFTAAAAQVAGATRPLLSALVDKSLVGRSGELYRLHDLSRQFGWEKVKQTGQTQVLQSRHAHYYANLLAQKARQLQGEEQAAALLLIEQEAQNVQAAWHWLTGQPDVNGLAAATDGYYHFLAIRSRFQEAADNFGAARLALQSFADQDLQARLVYARIMAREGRFLSFLSRYAAAQERLQASLEILHGLHERDEMAYVLGQLGGTARVQGNLEQARQWLQEGLALRRETGNRQGQAVALLELGGVAFMVADYEQCRAFCQEGLSLAELAGDRQTVAHLLTGLSLSCRELRLYELALDYGRRAQTIYEELGDQYGAIQAALTLGELNRQLGQTAEARRFCEQAIQISQEIGFLSGAADGHYRLGQIATGLEEEQAALQEFRLALMLAAQIEEIPAVLDSLLEIACLLVKVGDVARGHVALAFLRDQPQTTEPQRLRANEALANMTEEAALVQTALSLDEVLAMVRETSPTAIPLMRVMRATAVTAPPDTPSPLSASLPLVADGRYHSPQLIARGGMGEVYRAIDGQTGQTVAVKRLLPHLLTAGSNHLARFQREAEALRHLNHPNIVRLIDTFEADEQLTIVMEYLPGGSLQELLAGGEGLPRPQAIAIALELADALARTHHLGIIHRDLKPANVLLAADGTPRLTDFGIARLGQGYTRLTQQGTTMGTVAYMAPEAYLGEGLDARADTWSFGVMLYEMLTGRNPFAQEPFAATVTAVLHAPLPDIYTDQPDIPAPLAHLLQQILVRDRSQRLASMRQVAAQLEQVTLAILNLPRASD
ncbi:MAG: protein kinase [Chloroflexi bacterium]|nr:protein kinase [Ardenticatenaceae bacterium]MBL1129002.1 hypothetical protein [Chloroflexota bacterium]NOG35081.1 protein kinase [Chloroflexota bacterium]GIK59055.1 MAG: hypothetical protein BroJett015_47180 [Chloroflexota bacterium]